MAVATPTRTTRPVLPARLEMIVRHALSCKPDATAATEMVRQFCDPPLTRTDGCDDCGTATTEQESGDTYDVMAELLARWAE